MIATPDTKDITLPDKKTCFVVMGFGIKTDFATGRKLDLNKSYRLLIKPVVEEKNITCVRADELQISGTIDVPMYQELLKADLVIADLSTANVNAFYELGIRHALRPRTTIVISEDKLTYPFDVNHIKITSYTHLGDSIDYEEVERFRNVLGKTIETVLLDEQPDSPVYTFLGQLIPPSIREQVAETAVQIEKAISKHTQENSEEKTQQEATDQSQTLSVLTQQAEQALKRKDFITAKALFNTALLLGKTDTSHLTCNNSYIIHQLVLATYKAQQPNVNSALKEALNLLGQLDLDHTNDPETVSLAGAIKKLMFENGLGDEHLAEAILYFERAYFLLNNRYNGVNLAYLLTCRADSSLCVNKEDRIADLVWANRTRRRILEICEKEWLEINTRKDAEAKTAVMAADAELSQNQKDSEKERKFWVLINKAEAHFGLGEIEAYHSAYSDAIAVEHEPWMLESFEQQLIKLRVLLRRNGQLLNPAWMESVQAISEPVIPA